MRADQRAVLVECVRELHGIPAGADLGALSEPLRTWVDYALHTVERGRGVLDELPVTSLSPGFRLLDAGCAYGGYLVAAAEAGAGEVVGVDTDERLLSIARRLLGAADVPARLALGRLEDGQLMASLGTFDVITCADVLEHVDDPRRALANLCRALRPEGRLYLAIPNPQAPAWVRSDPHYQLFGITLLDRASAERCYRRLTGGAHYDVGELHELAFYRRALAAEGMRFGVINAPPPSLPALDDLLAATRELEAAAACYLDSRLPAETSRELRERALALARRIRREVAAARPRRRWQWWRGRRDPRDVLERYGVVTWHLLAQRDAPGKRP